MARRRVWAFVLVAILAGVGALLWSTRNNRQRSVSTGASRARAEQAADGIGTAGKGTTEESATAVESNPLAAELNTSSGTIRRDLEVLNNLFVNFQTNFPGKGNPVGENSEITAALTGANPLNFAFLPPNHPAINRAGELCDRWGTPFRFHQLSGTQMEIRSAGPDRKFGTADDVEFAPWPK
jgi:hypothetical protein